MRSTIMDLWNGSLAPIEDSGKNDTELQESVRLLELHKSKLEKALNDEQQQLFGKYASCMNDYINRLSEHAFSDGFSLACKLLTEAFSSEF